MGGLQAQLDMGHATTELGRQYWGDASMATERCDAAWCSLEGHTTSLMTLKQTKEQAASQCIWLLDLAATAWLLMLSLEPF